MKKFQISCLVDEYRVKINLFAISPNHALKFFQAIKVMWIFEYNLVLTCIS